MAKIRGKIIRILNRRTVIINLGSKDGISESSDFSILGKPEPVIDPETNEELGRVTVVKNRVKAQEVSERFTIAATKWTETRLKSLSLLTSTLTDQYTIEDIDRGELNVKQDEIQPWKAWKEDPVKVGDIVEVSIPEKRIVEEPLEEDEIENKEKQENES